MAIVTPDTDASGEFDAVNHPVHRGSESGDELPHDREMKDKLNVIINRHGTSLKGADYHHCEGLLRHCEGALREMVSRATATTKSF